jgi:hypothetical protein
MPCGFPVDALRSAFEFSPRSGDVVLATYPKCGTTWMQHILYMLHNGGNEIAGDASVRELVPHLEEMGADFVRDLPEPRLIKTHLARSAKLFNADARYVLVFRNPFDCAVSFYHHTRGFTQHYDFADGRFEEFLEVFNAGEVDFGDYFDHAVSWLDVAHAANVHFTTYERLHANLEQEIARLGAFLGGEAGRVAANADLRRRITAAASFGSMARDQQRWSSQRPAGMTEFVRKGIVGDWQAHFTKPALRALLARTEQRLAGTPLIGEWAEILGQVRRHCDSPQ